MTSTFQISRKAKQNKARMPCARSAQKPKTARGLTRQIVVVGKEAVLWLGKRKELCRYGMKIIKNSEGRKINKKIKI